MNSSLIENVVDNVIEYYKDAASFDKLRKVERALNHILPSYTIQTAVYAPSSRYSPNGLREPYINHIIVRGKGLWITRDFE